MSWKDVVASRRAFACALLVAYFVEYIWELFHLAIIYVLWGNLQRKRRRDKIEAEAVACFARRPRGENESRRRRGDDAVCVAEKRVAAMPRAERPRVLPRRRVGNTA